MKWLFVLSLSSLGWIAAHRHCPADEKAYEQVRVLQEKLEMELRQCQFDEIQNMMTSRFSFSIIENGCHPNECALLMGNSEILRGRYMDYDPATKRYICPGNIEFLIPEEQYMSHYSNGTIIVQKMDVSYRALDNSKISSYLLNYHWNPDHDCNYKLDFIDGHSVQCPPWVESLPVCTNCNDYLGAVAFVKLILEDLVHCNYAGMESSNFLNGPGTPLYFNVPCNANKGAGPLTCCQQLLPIIVLFFFGCMIWQQFGFSEPEFLRMAGQDYVVRTRTQYFFGIYPDMFIDFIVRNDGLGKWVVVSGFIGSDTICPDDVYPLCGNGCSTL